MVSSRKPTARRSTPSSKRNGGSVKSKVNPHVGSHFDRFLDDAGIRAEVEAAALKKIIAVALNQQMRQQGITVSALAGALGTSRAAVTRVLDHRNTSLTLATLSRTAAALGCRLHLSISGAVT